MTKKSTNKYYFSVEGQTEQWYMKWLQATINNTDESAYKVDFDCAVQKDPYKRAKSLAIIRKTEVYHFCDCESNESAHKAQFMQTIDQMEKAKKCGKQIEYKLGYSNFTFDLWIILHKIDCGGLVSHRKNYIEFLNRAYSKKYENMDEYKHEDNFKSCLKQLKLSDVVNAINRAKNIMEKNKENNYTLRKYKKYEYYEDNPSLSIWECIEKILVDCKLV